MRRRRGRLGLSAVLGFLLFAGAPIAASAAGILIVTQSETPRSVDRAALGQLPPITVHVSFLTSHGPEQGSYTGVLLWTLLDHTGSIDPKPRRRITRTVTVTGRDHFSAVLALAEIDPEFEGKPVVLAYRKDGHPIGADELRLVVPGDHRGGRSVRDVVRIDIR